MTSSDLKYLVETNTDSNFFDRSSMKFFGDTMRNYGAKVTTIDTRTEKGLVVYELYRRRAVKHGLSASAYFDADSLQRVFTEH